MWEYYEQFYAKLDIPDEMDRFLERHELPKLTQEGRKNLIRPIARKETEVVINKKRRRAQDQVASRVNLSKYLKNQYQSFTRCPKLWKKRAHFPTHFPRPLLPWNQNQTNPSEENYRPVLALMNIDVKILNKTLANQI